jgi:hypothetical protein
MSSSATTTFPPHPTAWSAIQVTEAKAARTGTILRSSRAAPPATSRRHGGMRAIASSI